MTRRSTITPDLGSVKKALEARREQAAADEGKLSRLAEERPRRKRTGGASGGRRITKMQGEKPDVSEDVFFLGTETRQLPPEREDRARELVPLTT